MTIKERAIAYTGEPENIVDFDNKYHCCNCFEGYDAYALAHAYSDGATEQKQIDEETYTEEMRKLNEEWKENLEILRQMLIDNAVKWVDENIGTLTAIALRKAMEK